MVARQLGEQLSCLAFLVRFSTREQQTAEELPFDAHTLRLGERLPYQSAPPQGQPGSEPGIVGERGLQP